MIKFLLYGDLPPENCEIPPRSRSIKRAAKIWIDVTMLLVLLSLLSFEGWAKGREGRGEQIIFTKAHPVKILAIGRSSPCCHRTSLVRTRRFAESLPTLMSVVCWVVFFWSQLARKLGVSFVHWLTITIAFFVEIFCIAAINQGFCRIIDFFARVFFEKQCPPEQLGTPALFTVVQNDRNLSHNPSSSCVCYHRTLPVRGYASKEWFKPFFGDYIKESPHQWR